MKELNSIVEEFELNFLSTSRKERLWTAFKAVNRGKQLRKFRESLSETKSTLMLSLMYQRFAQTSSKLLYSDILMLL